MDFIANIFFKGKIKCLTGLHIGGGQDKLEIGGVDSVVIRDPKTQYPYIPASSFKGKLRTMLEFGLAKVNPDGNVSKKTEVTRIFGKSAEDSSLTGPTRLLVRDSFPDDATTKMWQDIEIELLYTEFKAENFINRLTSEANPRFIERVPAESVFDLEMILGVYGDAATLAADLKAIFMALRMMEHNWLGKSGSRGYGKIEFQLNDLAIVTRKDYVDNSAAYQAACKNLKTTTFDDKKHLYRFDDTKTAETIAKIAAAIKEMAETTDTNTDLPTS